MSDSGQVLGSYWGLIAINVAFQLGFCTFVLSNYMKTLPHELYESAQLDGASVWRQYWQLTMPLVRPALAALGDPADDLDLQRVLLGDGAAPGRRQVPDHQRPERLRGQFFVDYNLLAAGSVLVALPVLIVFFVLQKQFVSGLTLGSTKG